MSYPRPCARSLFIAGILLLAGILRADDGDWRRAGSRQGIELSYRQTDSAYRAYRGAVAVCTDLVSLQTFVTDAARLEEWIAYTEEAHGVGDVDGREGYYVKTSAPWPFQSRDMIYQLAVEPAGTSGALRIGILGVPDAAPPQRNAVRMASAEGGWLLTPHRGRIRVTMWLTVDPVGVPAFFANRRLAAAVAGTLANLADRFPCRDAS